MKNSLLLYLSLVILTIFLPAGLTQASTSDEMKNNPVDVAQNLRVHLGNLESLHFNFTQHTSGQMSGRARKATGEAFFVKKGEVAKMRWNYLAPERQIIISDGNELSMYFENLNQQIIAPADTLQQDITYSLFTSKNHIEQDFVVSSGIYGDQESTALAEFEIIKLIPRSPNTQIQEIRLWITNQNQIKRIEIRDTFDTLTLLNINNIEENSLAQKKEIQDGSFFIFSPPEGTEIIRQ